MTFDLDQEERDLINRADELNREEIWALLEKKRYEDLHKKSVQLRGNIIGAARCPKCTLEPPCKHYESHEMLVRDSIAFMQSAEFKAVIPPNKREHLITSLRRTAANHLSSR